MDGKTIIWGRKFKLLSVSWEITKSSVKKLKRSYRSKSFISYKVSPAVTPSMSQLNSSLEEKSGYLKFGFSLFSYLPLLIFLVLSQSIAYLYAPFIMLFIYDAFKQ